MWRSTNKLDGRRRHLILYRFISGAHNFPRMFQTRRECAEFIKEDYGYIAKRADLRREPHGWRMPIPVKVKVSMSGGYRE